MPTRCLECHELAYRHPLERRGERCDLTPAMVYRRAGEWRELEAQWRAGIINDAELQRRLVDVGLVVDLA